MTVLAAAAGVAVMTAGQLGPPPPVQDLSVTERLGARVPGDLVFTDAAGRRVALADSFDGDTPVVMALAYVRCETLCNLVLRGVADAARESELELGRDYRVVTVSIDPRESAGEASAQQAALLQLAGRAPDHDGWAMLTGDEPAIRRLADALGFAYSWDPRTEQFAHPAVVFTLTGDGRVMRYLYGTRYTGGALDEAIGQARRGEAVPTGDGGGALGCFRFDPALRAQWGAIARFYAVGGALLIAVIGGGIALLIRKERRAS